MLSSVSLIVIRIALFLPTSPSLSTSIFSLYLTRHGSPLLVGIRSDFHVLTGNIPVIFSPLGKSEDVPDLTFFPDHGYSESCVLWSTIMGVGINAGLELLESLRHTFSLPSYVFFPCRLWPRWSNIYVLLPTSHIPHLPHTPCRFGPQVS